MTREDYKILQARLESHGIRQPIETASRVIRRTMNILPTPQCSSGTTQSRPFPARAVKVMESAGPNKERQTRAKADKVEGGSPRTSASVTAGRDRHSESSLEVKFFDLWTACRGPSLRCQYKFCEERYWRADFAHLESKTLIEIDGGVWLPGGHNMAGKVRDCEKDLEAILNGWRVVRLVPSMITVSTVERLIAFLR